MLRLAKLSDDKASRRQAEQLVKLYAATLKTNPTSVPLMAEALDAILATGGFAPDAVEPKVEAPTPPANPKFSADVTAVAFAVEPFKDGLQSFTVTLAMAKPWHLYANPPLGKDLAESATSVEILLDGKVVEAKLDYPAGAVQKDAGGDYRIYSGTTVIRGSVKGGGKLTVRVKIVACNDKNCLLPSTLKAEAK